jgi:hypothetical protein
MLKKITGHATPTKTNAGVDFIILQNGGGLIA